MLGDGALNEKAVEAAVTNRMKRQGLPLYGPYRATVERQLRSDIAAYLAHADVVPTGYTRVRNDELARLMLAAEALRTIAAREGTWQAEVADEALSAMGETGS